MTRGTIMTDIWYDRVQGATSNLATNHKNPWESGDVEFVLQFTDEVRDEDIAIALGRTLASITSITHLVRTKGHDAVRASYARPVVREAPTFDFVTTFPEGWND
jgi:hypothetical protein